MKNWINRLRGGSDAPSTPPAAQADGADEQAADLAAEIDATYYRWLTAARGYTAPAEVETRILDEIRVLAGQPGEAAGLVPRVPEAIPKLLSSLNDEDVSVAQLARQVAQDVVLVAEVIREANSPYYRSSAPVRTIEGAVMLLGQNGMRMLLARAAFRPIISMQTGRLARHAAPQVWSQSEKCALAASLLAPALGANPFEAYLAGLMQNVGLVVAFRVIDQAGPGDGLPQSDGLLGELLAAARALSAAVAREWDFPPQVAAAIEQAGDPDAAPLAQALAQGDRLATLRVLVDGGVFKADDPKVVDGMDAGQRSCFDKLRTEENDAVPD